MLRLERSGCRRMAVVGSNPPGNWVTQKQLIRTQVMFVVGRSRIVLLLSHSEKHIKCFQEL